MHGGRAEIIEYLHNFASFLDESQRITPDLIHDGAFKLSAGKKRHVLVKVIEIYEINN